MPALEDIKIKRQKKGDKQKEKYERNGKYTSKSIRIKQAKQTSVIVPVQSNVNGKK
jgi:hypothetical protein